MKKLLTRTLLCFILVLTVFTAFISEKISADAAERTALVLDTDAGTDDAAALLLMKQLNIIPDYIIATGGNASADGALRNSVILKKYLNLSSTLVRGYEARLSEEKNTFHGPDGFAGISAQMLKDYKITQEDLDRYDSLEAFEDKLMGYDRIEYIVTGPLSTLAHLCNNEIIDDKLEHIYLMGGGINEFNTSHETEFNFSKNPAAVKTVLSEGPKITLFPLDLTNHQRITETRIAQLKSSKNIPEFITLLNYNRKANTEYNSIPTAVLHDTMPVLFYADKSHFQTQHMRLSCDEYGHIEESEAGYPVEVVLGVDSRLLFEQLQTAFNNPDIQK